MEPFHFRSFDRILGIACDVPSLYYGMKCLATYDRGALEYQLKEGHISTWLDYIGEHDLAKSIGGQKGIESALETLKKAIDENNSRGPVRRGMRMQSRHMPGMGGPKHQGGMVDRSDK